MPYIRVIEPEEASGELREEYERLLGSRGKLAAIHTVHSLSPQALRAYWKDEARLEALRRDPRDAGPDGAIDNIMKVHGLRPHTMEGHLALYKATLHHAGLRRLLNDDDRETEMRRALERRRPEDAFEGRDLAVLRYAEALTVAPEAVDETLLDAMRAEGMSDGEILETNQVVAYVAYANRTVLGLSPSAADDPDDWSHR